MNIKYILLFFSLLIHLIYIKYVLIQIESYLIISNDYYVNYAHQIDIIINSVYEIIILNNDLVLIGKLITLFFISLLNNEFFILSELCYIVSIENSILLKELIIEI